MPSSVRITDFDLPMGLAMRPFSWRRMPAVREWRVKSGKWKVEAFGMGTSDEEDAD